MKPLSLELGLAALFLLAGGCADGEAGAGSRDDGNAVARASEPVAGHVHAAPHGGVLVDLVRDTATVEVVVDPNAGRLDLYLLGPHLANFVRSTQQRIGVRLLVGADSFTVDAHGMASTLTGETVGDTSHFVAVDGRLLGVRRFDGTLVRVEMFGQTYDEKRFSWIENPGK